MSTAARLIDALRERDQSVAAAESLTGGLLVATLVEVPGASDVVAGGVVAYTATAKAEVLGVSSSLLDERGTVDARVAEQMADRVRSLYGSDWALSTTGVAGPGPHEGHPAGTVHVGLAGPDGSRSVELLLGGDRSAIRAATVQAALGLLLDRISA